MGHLWVSGCDGGLVGAAVQLRLFLVFLESDELGFVAGDDYLADAAVIDVVLGAVAIEGVTARET